MLVIPRLVFVLALVVVPVVVWATTASLPPRVATHFGSGGLANGWMTRDGYRAFMLVLTTLVPLFAAGFSGLVPRLAFARPKGVLRNREYWLAPERRAATVAWLASHACWLGTLVSALLLAIHFLTVDANAQSPARLSEPAMFTTLGVFAALLAIWILALALRFRRPR